MPFVVTIGSRWRRRRDGQVLVIRQVYRADRQVLVCPEGTSDPFVENFTDLRKYHELLVSVEGAA